MRQLLRLWSMALKLPLWSPRATTTEAACPKASIPQEKPLQWEARAMQLEK